MWRLALTGTDADKQAARTRWSTHPTLRADLLGALGAPVPAKPSQNETLQRIFTARALGVLGGDDVAAALLAAGPHLGGFDEALQVLRVAYLVASPLETPLAFTLPHEVRAMADVLAAAQRDLDLQPPPPPPPRVAEPSLATPDVRESLLTVGAALLGLWAIRRGLARRRLRS